MALEEHLTLLNVNRMDLKLVPWNMIHWTYKTEWQVFRHESVATIMSLLNRGV